MNLSIRWYVYVLYFIYVILSHSSLLTLLQHSWSDIDIYYMGIECCSLYGFVCFLYNVSIHVLVTLIDCNNSRVRANKTVEKREKKNYETMIHNF